MAKSVETVFVSKKRDGLELEFRLNYFSRNPQLTSVEKIRIENWCRQQVLNNLQAFRMAFPEI